MSEIKKYIVDIYFSGHTYVKVEAENEDEADQIARNILSNTKGVDSLTRFDIDGVDILES